MHARTGGKLAVGIFFVAVMREEWIDKAGLEFGDN
jgi:hypothetical protein